MKPYFRILCALIALIISPQVSLSATGNISKVVFTSDVRSVANGATSETITIQLQNSGGSEEKLDDTADVEFTTTSVSGEFLGGTGKPITGTMSKNSANKTFYYRDTTDGSPNITVHVTPRSGGGGWSASQTVHIGAGGGDTHTADEDDDRRADDTTTTGTTTTTAVSTTSSGKSHSSSVKLSTFTKKTALQVGAGRTRTVLINTPVVFEAETNQNPSGSSGSKRGFLWTFGDGASKIGNTVTHVYRFPGEYNVVLNADYRGEHSVSRTRVSVINPDISITNVHPGASGYIEIRNNLKDEVNLNDWKLSIGDDSYIIPTDTIISAESSVRIPNQVSFMLPRDTASLLFPDDDEAFVWDKKSQKVVTKVEKPVSKAVVATFAPLIVAEAAVVAATTAAPVVPLPIRIESVAPPKDGGIIKFVKSLFTIH